MTDQSFRRQADHADMPLSPRSPRWRAWLLRFARDWAAVVLFGTLAVSGFARIGEDVLAHESTSFDGAVQGWMLSHQHPLGDRIFYWITTLGGIGGMGVLALAGTGYLWHRGRRRVAAGVLVAPVMAIALFSVVKRFYARPRPIGLGGRVDSSFAFPSGHATSAAAVCCTLAYVLWREGLLRGRTALGLAVIVPLLVGISRLYLNVHWATDVLGGWCAGLLIAVLSIALYDRHRRRRTVDRHAPPAIAPPTTQSSSR